MKILLINWQDPANPQAGGAEIHLREVFTRIADDGHEVTWLASGWRGAPATDHLGRIEVRRTGSRYTFGVASAIHYRRHLAATPFDVVVEALNKVPVYSPLWSGRRVVLLVHHLFGTTAFQEASLPFAALTWLQERPLAAVYRNAPIEAISESSKADLIGRGLPASAIEVIFPGVDLAFFRPPSSPSRADIPTFLYLGRLRRYKRVDLVLRAFADLVAAGVAGRLIIAGKGDDQARLRTLSSNLGLDGAVEFPGFVSENEKLRLFRSSWANVFVSPKEGWGITNLEAAACGTLTIASDSPGLRESVVHERTGLLVPHGDQAALTAAMLRVATEGGLVDRLSRQAAGFASDFTWERCARLTQRHLEDVVHGSS